MKKVLSILIVAALLLSALPITVFAIEADDLAETGVTMIESVSVTGITEPVAGESPIYSAAVSDGNGYGSPVDSVIARLALRAAAIPQRGAEHKGSAILRELSPQVTEGSIESAG